MSVLSHKDVSSSGAYILRAVGPKHKPWSLLARQQPALPRVRALKISAADLGFQGSGIQALRSRQLLAEESNTKSKLSRAAAHKQTP